MIKIFILYGPVCTFDTCWFWYMYKKGTFVYTNQSPLNLLTHYNLYTYTVGIYSPGKALVV